MSIPGYYFFVLTRDIIAQGVEVSMVGAGAGDMHTMLGLRL